jgi:hypothetical protein
MIRMRRAVENTLKRERVVTQADMRGGFPRGPHFSGAALPAYSDGGDRSRRRPEPRPREFRGARVVQVQ